MQYIIRIKQPFSPEFPKEEQGDISQSINNKKSEYFWYFLVFYLGGSKMKYWELGHLSHVNKVTTLLSIILDDVDFFEIFLLKRSFSAKAKSFVFKISPPQESAPLKLKVRRSPDNQL